jgi:hypothetical protein
MWRDLLLFVPLAVLTNTAFPLSFDPVLLYFASRYDFGPACAFALLGSLCAAAGALVDMKLIGAARDLGLPGRLGALSSRRGAWLYLLTFLVALSPLPFSIVRLALLQARPDPALFGLSVGLGRLPRYVMTVYFWQSLAPPAWASAGALASAAALALWKWRHARRSPARDRRNV